jgi:prepilin-type N-terminal cleavage/methylation domain-containing protein/prepilin-type processing-associated H-X9-DG protein
MRKIFFGHQFRQEENQMQPVRHVTKRGFTLIELLVVISIIVLLAAILFPVFARARENARRASCQSNLKQLALGIHQYVQDYDEYFPRVYTIASGNWAGGDWKGWATMVEPYVKSEQVYACPSRANKANYNANQYYRGGGSGYGLTYATNDHSTGITSFGFDETGVGGAAQEPLKSSAIARSSETIMLGEEKSTASGAEYGEPYLYNWLGNGQTGFNTQTSTPWHFEGVNVAFADGHVKWMKVEKLKVATYWRTD